MRWLVILAMLTVPAMARAPAMSDPDLAPWFRSLRTPSDTMSCCDQSDGHILKDSEIQITSDNSETLARGDLHYQISIDGAWVPVPNEAILQRADNPTGQYVAFWLPGTTNILCFVRPSET